MSPARNRIVRFRAVVTAAQAVGGYRDRLVRARLGTSDVVASIKDVEEALAGLTPIPAELYQSFFTVESRRGGSVRTAAKRAAD